MIRHLALAPSSRSSDCSYLGCLLASHVSCINQRRRVLRLHAVLTIACHGLQAPKVILISILALSFTKRCDNVKVHQHGSDRSYSSPWHRLNNAEPRCLGTLLHWVCGSVFRHRSNWTHGSFPSQAHACGEDTQHLGYLRHRRVPPRLSTAHPACLTS